MIGIKRYGKPVKVAALLLIALTVCMPFPLLYSQPVGGSNTSGNAWQYFYLGNSFNPTTGLPQGETGWGKTWFNFWQFALAIDGIIGAYRNGLIDGMEYFSRINRILLWVENTMTYREDSMPWYAYYWDGTPKTSPAEFDRDIDFADWGRTLNALGWLRRTDYSTFGSRVDALLSPSGKLYTAMQTMKTWNKGLDVYGRDVAIAYTYFVFLDGSYNMQPWLDNFYSLWSTTDPSKRMNDTYGSSMPKLGVNLGTPSYELAETSGGGAPDTARTLAIVQNIASWAKARYDYWVAHGKSYMYSVWGTELFARITSSSTVFAYEFYIVDTGGGVFKTWQVKDTSVPGGKWYDEGQVYSTTSTNDAAFALKTAGISNSWADAVFQRFTDSNLRTSYGSYDGVYEKDNTACTVRLSVEHNAVILMHLTGAWPGQRYFHTSSEFWFSYYDLVYAGYDAICVLNLGWTAATVHIYFPGLGYTDTFSMNSGAEVMRSYSGKRGGPVHIWTDNPSEDILWVTQRVLGWSGFQEILGSSEDSASTKLSWTWYDFGSSVSGANIFVLNPGSQTASVQIYVHGVLKTNTQIGAGQELITSYPGVTDGPVELVSSQPVLASQRCVTNYGGTQDFDEIIGMPYSDSFIESWFTWYDSKGTSADNIHMVNHGSSTASVSIYIHGQLQSGCPFSIAPGAEVYKSYSGKSDGPVKVVSTQPLLVTQRIVGWNGFKEVFGTSSSLMAPMWWFTWYDNSAGLAWIHVVNPTQTAATVRVYIAGVNYGPYTVNPGTDWYFYQSGIASGPVAVYSNTAISATIRTTAFSSFVETLGVSE